MSNRSVYIHRCPDPSMWYRDKVGQVVSIVKEDRDYYWSRENAGYLNIILKSDAYEVVGEGSNDHLSVAPGDFKGDVTLNTQQTTQNIVSDAEIIELRRNTKIKDVTVPYSDTLEFSRALLKLVFERLSK